MRYAGKTPAVGRFAAIDGLRGYLALAVFISHTAIWYFYLRTGRWEVPPSRLYTHLGESSVMLFFMITGFLFYSKLLDARRVPVDWTRLFVSRVLRLFPMYLFALLAVFGIVAYLSAGHLRVPLGDLIWRGVEWLSFSLPGSHDLNGVRDTSVILANVTWSLVYEWIFYGLLPLLSLTVARIPPMPFLLASGVVAVCAGFLQLSPIRSTAFLGGICAAFLARDKRISAMARSPAAGLIVLLCLFLDASFFPTAYAPVPIALLSMAFSTIACGNTLFGVLTRDVSRFLGELSYGIYLLHGILLYSVFRLGIGLDRAAELSPAAHCVVALSCTPLLIGAAYAAHCLIERPGMLLVPDVTEWLYGKMRARNLVAASSRTAVPESTAG